MKKSIFSCGNFNRPYSNFSYGSLFCAHNDKKTLASKAALSQKNNKDLAEKINELEEKIKEKEECQEGFFFLKR